MKRIGILTYTSNYNMGSFWQAYASLQTVKKVFPDAHVEIVNYHRESIQNKVKYNRWVVLKKRHLNPRYLLNDILGRKRYRACQRHHLAFDPACGFYNDNPVKAWEYLDSLRYDCIFVGSDTLLEFKDYHYLKNTIPVYWLPPDLKAKKFFLSASAGTHPPNLTRLSVSQKKQIKDSLSDFERLGVRDEITRDLVLSLTDQDKDRIEIIPDPTFLVDINTSFAKTYLERKGIDLKAPILGVDIPMTVPGLKPYINRLSQQDWQIISWRIRHRKGLIDCSDIGPLEWAGMFSFFTLTITNRFHAAIFSLKNKVPLLSIDCKPGRYLSDGWSKSSSLLKHFGLSQTAHTNLPKLNGVSDLSGHAEQALNAFDDVQVTRTLVRLKKQIETYLKHIAKTQN